MITLKKKTYGYVERDEESRKEFIETLSKIESQKRVYIDEAGIDDDEVYPYAWGKKGHRIYGMKKGLVQKE